MAKVLAKIRKDHTPTEPGARASAEALAMIRKGRVRVGRT